ncbi:MAG: rhamnulokinase [Clostridiales Family XIII bacterium]|jgi:rhamnulokinase/L-fuculokinase|nr:rhamnulokinase [Clostridiales Family XIII bacterium]
MAFDFGASSGRAILGAFDGRKLAMDEIHRFENNPVYLRGTYYWDFLALYRETLNGLAAGRESGFDSIGIDTWGVDFGLLDSKGDLVQNPVHYRDARTKGMVAELQEKAGLDLHLRTGTETMEINTAVQLYALAKCCPDLLERAGGALMMPDLFGYFLTGAKTAEYSIASTTQMLDPHSGQWDKGLAQAIGIKDGLFPDVAPSGGELGRLLPEIQKELNIGGARVISVAGHDTESAIVAVPAEEEDFFYISCGTWSLMGTELRAPIINEGTARMGVTNEGGYGGRIQFLKNLAGLWLLQEARRQYMREGRPYGYPELGQMALGEKPFAYLIDPDAPEFAPPGDMPRRIRGFCERTGQGSPERPGEIARCIYESTALKYRLAFDGICALTGKDYSRVHMVGGGTKAGILCQMAANALGRELAAGSPEATAIGNIAVQLISLGELGGLGEARAMARESFPETVYSPQDGDAWLEALDRFRGIVGRA